jgi:glycosyltransferase involved in cell wall biosynthesis
MTYSIVIPAHNEEQTIESHVEGFILVLPAKVREVLVEIIIVENGSREGTLKAAERLASRHPGLVRVLSQARGSYGEAIKAGMMAACGSHLSILECDFLDAGFVASSIEKFALNGSPLIVASKRHPRSIDRRPLKRRLLTLGFNAILRLTTGYPGSDTHGLKSIETKLAQRLCNAATTTDEVFQTEIVLLAWRWGVEIEELPIEVQERRPAPVSVRSRLPMVLRTVGQLRRSLRRFPGRLNQQCQPVHG